MFLHLSPHASCNKALCELVKTGEKRKRGKYHRGVVKQQQSPVGKNASIIQYDIQMSSKQSFVLLNTFLKRIAVKWPPQPPSPSYGGDSKRQRKCDFDYWKTLLTCCLILHPKNMSKWVDVAGLYKYLSQHGVWWNRKYEWAIQSKQQASSPSDTDIQLNMSATAAALTFGITNANSFNHLNQLAFFCCVSGVGGVWKSAEGLAHTH